MVGTSGSENVSTKQAQIAKLAAQAPQMVFTTLAHHMDVEWLQEAYRRTRKSGAVGVDGQTARAYAEQLEENLPRLLELAKSGQYRAPKVRRVHIPKGRNQTRPIGIPTFEDKLLQRAIVMLLEPIYEQDFLDCSYGFRPKRSAHDALESFWQQGMDLNGCWVLEVDIRNFFGELDHKWIREMVERRVRDGVVLRLLGKWLHAGVQEEGTTWYPDSGTPQGGVISPLLANIYLHEVLDKWFEEEVRPRLDGRSFLVRYADDLVMGFASQADAQRVLNVLPKRLGKFGLRLHPEKTRLVRFRRPPRALRGKSGGSFQFLGFVHFWARSRRGAWAIKRKTMSERRGRFLRELNAWCRRHRHDPVGKQQMMLNRKLRGHYGYYGITGNYPALEGVYEAAKCIWRKWLDRRSQRARMKWERFDRLLKRHPLMVPKISHSYVT